MSEPTLGIADVRIPPEVMKAAESGQPFQASMAPGQTAPTFSMGGPPQPAQKPFVPDWKDVAASPKYQGLKEEQRAAVRNRYFLDFVAPNVPTDKLAAVKASFDAETNPPPPSLWDRTKSAVGDVVESLKPGGSVMAGMDGKTVEPGGSSTVLRQYMQTAYDRLSPEKRAARVATIDPARASPAQKAFLEIHQEREVLRSGRGVTPGDVLGAATVAGPALAADPRLAQPGPTIAAAANPDAYRAVQVAQNNPELLADARAGIKRTEQADKLGAPDIPLEQRIQDNMRANPNLGRYDAETLARKQMEEGRASPNPEFSRGIGKNADLTSQMGAAADAGIARAKSGILDSLWAFANQNDDPTDSPAAQGAKMLARTLFNPDGKGGVKRMEMARQFEQQAEAYAPRLMTTDFDTASKNKEIVPWMLVQASAQSPQVAGMLAAIVVPEIAPIILPAMATTAAGNQYAENIAAGVDKKKAAADALVNGLAELGGEFLGLKAAQLAGPMFKSTLSKLPQSAKDALAASLVARATAGAATLTGTALMEGGSEVATGFAQDLSQKLIAGRDAGDLMANARTNFMAALLPGAAFGIPGAISAAAGSEQSPGDTRPAPPATTPAAANAPQPAREDKKEPIPEAQEPVPAAEILGTPDDPEALAAWNTAKAEIDAAANEAATSPLNDTPQPTDAQKEAGNYKKGHISLHGMDIAIENPQGSERKGVDAGGQPWSVTMPAHYGYVKGSKGKDGDHVDVYIGPNPASDKVFVVDQLDLKTGKFDEHKAVLGTDSLEAAQELYQAGFSDGKGAARIGAITEMSANDFRAWVADEKATRKPLAYIPGQPAAVPEDFQKNGQTRTFRNQAAAEAYRDARNGLAGYVPRETADGWILSKPAEPRAEKRGLQTPDDIAIGEFMSRAAKKGLSEADARELAPRALRDDVTGFYDGRVAGVKSSVIQRAIQYAEESKAESHLVALDIANLGGLNAFVGDDTETANRHFRALTDFVETRLKSVGADLIPMRTGGDEMMIVAAGISKADLNGAIEGIRKDAAAYIAAEGLDNIPNPKGKAPGLGLHIGTADISPSGTVSSIIKAAEKGMKAKEADNEYGKQPAAAGPGQPDGAGIDRGPEEQEVSAGVRSENRSGEQGDGLGVDQPGAGAAGSPVDATAQATSQAEPTPEPGQASRPDRPADGPEPPQRDGQEKVTQPTESPADAGLSASEPVSREQGLREFFQNAKRKMPVYAIRNADGEIVDWSTRKKAMDAKLATEQRSGSLPGAAVELIRNAEQIAKKAAPELVDALEAVETDKGVALMADNRAGIWPGFYIAAEGKVSSEQSAAKASRLTDIPLTLPVVEVNDPARIDVPMWLDSGGPQISVNTAVPQSPAATLQAMTEELAHHLDVVGPGRSIAASSLRYAPGGDLRAEAEAAMQKSAALDDFLAYPLAKKGPSGVILTPRRIKAELFARLLTVYHGQTQLRSILPKNFEVFDGLQKSLVGTDQAGGRLSGEVRQGGTTDQIRGGQRTEPGARGTDEAGRGDGDRARLERGRAYLAKAIAGSLRGASVESSFDSAAKTQAPPSEGLVVSGKPAAQTLAENGGMTVKGVRAVIADAIDKLDVPVRIVAGPEQAQAMGLPAESGVAGLATSDTIVLIASGIRSPRHAQFVLWHEAFHAGFRRQNPSRAEYGNALRDIAGKNPKLRQEAAAWRAKHEARWLDRFAELGYTPQEAAEDVQLLSIEEALADRSGEVGGVLKLKGWSQFAAAIQRLLRKIGLNDLASWIESRTGAEALSLIVAARDAAMGKSPEVPASLVPAQSMQNPVWRSALADAVATMKMNAAPAAQWKATLKNQPGVKPDELEWSGLNEWLDMQPGKVTKEAIQDYLRQNGVQVQDVVLGGSQDAVERANKALKDYLVNEKDFTPSGANDYALDAARGELTESQLRYQTPEQARLSEELRAAYQARDEESRSGTLQTKFGQWQLPGGENYRELLLTLPPTDLSAEYRAWQKRMQDKYGIGGSAKMTAAEMSEGARLKDSTGRANPVFVSSHFDQPNILAHVRFNGRTDAEGKRVLFIEEIQSDWGQAAKKKGFRGEPQFLPGMEGQVDGYLGVRDGVPKAPFVGKTEAWVALAVKRMIRYAAENGFDRVAFTTGEQQAARYDLSKQIDAIKFNKMPDGYIFWTAEKAGQRVAGGDNKPEELADLIGKEPAEKIIARADDGPGVLKGIDLKIGGEGMLTFYDKIVPNVVNDVLKKLGGGKVANIRIEIGAQPPKSAGFKREYPAVEQPGFDITPAMRDKALQGMPVFSMSADFQPKPSSRGIVESRSDDLQGGRRRNADGTFAADYVLDDPPKIKRKIVEVLRDRFDSTGTFNLWDKTVGTPFHQAWKDADFRRVYEAANNFIEDVSLLAVSAADMAPMLLPKTDTLWSAFTPSPLNKVDQQSISKALLRGTVEEVVYKTAQEAKLTNKQFAAYQEARAAVNRSLEDTAVSNIYRSLLVHKIKLELRESGMLDAHRLAKEALAERNATEQQAVDAARSEMISIRNQWLKTANGPEKNDLDKKGMQAATRLVSAQRRLQQVVKTTQDIDALVDRITDLQEKGYFPLMRWGRHTLAVYQNDKVEFFGMFESLDERNAVARAFRAEMPAAKIVRGEASQNGYEMFRGVNPESLQALVEAAGESDSGIFEQYIRMAASNHSAMKRLLRRKTIPGFSPDVTRALAAFITSNARLASRNFHMREAMEAFEAIPKEKGDVIDQAAKLLGYLQNPGEEANFVRGMLFNWFLGGNISSALINMMQPVQTTIPYLSQYGPLNASAAVTAALPKVYRKSLWSKALTEAIGRAEQYGVTAPHEVHMLQAEATRSFGSNSVVRRVARIWGSFFAIAEAFNRKLSFIAAFEMASKALPTINQTRAKRGEAQFATPYDFAADTVRQTQFVYGKQNRPQWARGPIGSVLFTFKQFSISMLEFISRMPPQQKMTVLGCLVILAGLEGLPFAEDLEDLIDTIGQSLGYDTNSKEALRRAAVRYLGKDGGKFIVNGVSGLGLPLDVQGRFGMGNLIPGTGVFKRSNTAGASTREASQVFGPVGGLFQQFADALDAWQAGNGIDKILTQLAPVAVKNVVKGAEMGSTGWYRDAKGRNVVPATERDAYVKGAGFQPGPIADQREAERIQLQNINLAKNVESDFAEAIARAAFNNDQVKLQEAIQRLNDWNKTNPQTPIQITRQQIERRVQEMHKTSAERLYKSAPRELRGATGEAVQKQ